MKMVVDKKIHRSYNQELKLLPVEWSKEHGENGTAHHFHIDRKRICEWMTKEAKNRKMRKQKKDFNKIFYSRVEKKLKKDYPFKYGGLKIMQSS